LISETLNKKSKSAVDLFFTKMNVDILNKEFEKTKQKNEQYPFWEDHLHPYDTLSDSERTDKSLK